MWQYYGQERPDFAVTPAPGQESVWDYPRPPALMVDHRNVLIETLAGDSLAASTRALRLCETASPPQFYIPMTDVDMSALVEMPDQSFCEWKGRARYWRLRTGGEAISWDYPDVNETYQALSEHLAFYPGRLNCQVGGCVVIPQPGEYYGGWVTPELVGPFKGEAGTGHW